MKSILQKSKRCLVCGTERDLHVHHVFFGWGLRAQSEKYGLTVNLCARHHNMSNEGVHFDHEFDLRLKRAAQEKAMIYYGWSIEDFRKIFVRNYIYD